MVDRQRKERSRRGLWWWLLLLGAAIVVCGFLGGTRYYGDPETEGLGDLAFWGMLAGGCLTLGAAIELIRPALQRGLARLIADNARRYRERQSATQNANPDHRNAA
ncbi:hypothetical protein GCM10010425_79510 [Streptomyces spororaveus]|uniref:Uncharacterized protein n=1 Tax=Streptomyces spororaveus TaxID=284039 RepID=A0ABQ3T2U0_9ACTN|nr:hypothetical protein Sspor_02560 [Streptomyces spororaveus]